MEYTSSYCGVKGCYSRYGPMKGNRHLFRFPKDVEKCKQWAAACGQMDFFKYKLLCGEMIYNSSCRICSLHFEERMYAGKKRKRLHADAIPTLLLGTSNSSSPILERYLVSGSQCHSAPHSVSTVSQNINDVLPGASSPLNSVHSLYKTSAEGTGVPDPFDFIEVKGEPVEVAEFKECDGYIGSSFADINEDGILQPATVTDEIKCVLPTDPFEVNLESAGHKNMTSGGAHVKTDRDNEFEHLTGDIDVNLTFDDIEIDKMEDISESEDLVPNYGNDGTLNCEICKKPLLCRSRLLTHWPIHLVMKPFKCSVCCKQYLRKSDLAVHELLHLGQKFFKCGGCNKLFVRHSNLVRHRIDHFKDRPFKCEICLELFAKECNLVDHQRTHSDKPFKCHFCFEQFSSKKNLISHFPLCSRKNRFTCNVCSKMFSKKGYLRAHQRIHSGEKPFKCAWCFKNFSQKWSLIGHQRGPCERSITVT